MESLCGALLRRLKAFAAAAFGCCPPFDISSANRHWNMAIALALACAATALSAFDVPIRRTLPHRVDDSATAWEAASVGATVTSAPSTHGPGSPGDPVRTPVPLESKVPPLARGRRRERPGWSSPVQLYTACALNVLASTLTLTSSRSFSHSSSLTTRLSFSHDPC